MYISSKIQAENSDLFTSVINARGVMVIVLGGGLDDPTLKSGRDCLDFALKLLGQVWILLFSQLWVKYLGSRGSLTLVMQPV